MSSNSTRPRKKIAIVGGGYAGLSAALELNRLAPDLVDVQLVDSRKEFIKSVHLHKTLFQPLEKFQLPFEKLGETYGFTFHEAKISSSVNLPELKAKKRLELMEGGILEFDALLFAQGAGSLLPDGPSGDNSGGRLINLEAVKAGQLPGEIKNFISRTAGGTVPTVTFVGGGPTGLQFLFELAYEFKVRNIPARIRLVELGTELFAAMPEAFRNYVMKRLADWQVEVLFNTRFLEARERTVLLKDEGTGVETEVPSALNFWFPGMRQDPLFETDMEGRILLDGQAQSNLFSAGDCSHYAGYGLNSLTAQAAVRKGKVVAENMRRIAQGREFYRIYDYKELGFFMSMGPGDGVGWMLTQNNILTGLPAFAVKEAIEAQFDLFVKGVDTYVNLSLFM